MTSSEKPKANEGGKPPPPVKPGKVAKTTPKATQLPKNHRRGPGMHSNSSTQTTQMATTEPGKLVKYLSPQTSQKATTGPGKSPNN